MSDSADRNGRTLWSAKLDRLLWSTDDLSHMQRRCNSYPLVDEALLDHRRKTRGCKSTKQRKSTGVIRKSRQYAFYEAETSAMRCRGDGSVSGFKFSQAIRFFYALYGMDMDL